MSDSSLRFYLLRFLRSSSCVRYELEHPCSNDYLNGYVKGVESALNDIVSYLDPSGNYTPLVLDLGERLKLIGCDYLNGNAHFSSSLRK